MPYLSGQLGTDQLGLAQLGQFKKLGGGGGPHVIDGNAQAVLEAVATPFSSGGLITLGSAIVINGSTRLPLEARATPLSAGALITGPPPAAGGKGRRGFWWWYQPSELGFELIQDELGNVD